MLKLLGTLALTLFITISTSWAASCDSADSSSRDKYILIHGIGGSDSGFGHMKEALEEQINCSSVFYFSYDTKNSELRVNDFSKKLDEFVSSLPSNSINPKDINLIMHSQGGLVGMNWIINSYLGKEGFTKGLSSRVNRYISNSTPFWGSDFALMGEKFFFSFGVDDNIISPFGLLQLERMKYGSNFYQNFMTTLTDKKNTELHTFLKSEIDIINISALSFKSGSIFRKFSQFFEGDLIVNIPSMKLNFNYQKFLSTNYESTSFEKAEMKRFQFAKHSYVTGSHLKMLPGIEGVIDVPKECLTLGECEHEAYLNIVEYISKGDLINNSEIDESIQGFDIHVLVDLPKELEDREDLELNIVEVNDFITVSHYLFKKNTQNSLSTNKDTAYFVLKGTLKKAGRGVFKVQITHPEIKPRTLEIKVEAGLITHVKTVVVKK